QDDWFELYNRSTNLPVALRGLYVGATNALFQIKSLSFMPPGSFLQLNADELPASGAAHIDFKLPAGGSYITLYNQTGLLLDSVTYTAQTQGISQGRFPNGSATIT